MRRAIGIDFGGSKALACVVDERGTVCARLSCSTGRATCPARALEIIARLYRELGAEYGPFAALGIGFPGLVDVSRGLARSSVMLDGWRDVALAERVSGLLGGIPCVVDNDVNCAAIAESRVRGDLPGGMVFVAVGTGIGGAIVFGHTLWRGASGVAGEIGNTTVDVHGPICFCGRRGCLNALASGTAIEAAAGLAAGTLDANTEDLACAIPLVQKALARAEHALGAGIANIVNFLNPEVVVVGGGVARLGAQFLGRVEAHVRAQSFEEAHRACRLEFARTGYDAGAVGAALFALERLGARESHPAVRARDRSGTSPRLPSMARSASRPAVVARTTRESAQMEPSR